MESEVKDLAHLVECLPSKCKALDSVHSTEGKIRRMCLHAERCICL